MAGITYQTPSQLLAQRAIDAQNGQGYQTPDSVVLPGALRSVAMHELELHHAAGRMTLEIVDHINAEWRAVNAVRLAQRRDWVNRTYAPGIERRRQGAIRAQADEMRRRAAIERLIDEEIAKQGND